MPTTTALELAWQTLPTPPTWAIATVAVALTVAAFAGWHLVRARTARQVTWAAATLAAAVAVTITAVQPLAAHPDRVTAHLAGPVADVLADHDLTGTHPHAGDRQITTRALDRSGAAVDVTITIPRDGHVTVTVE